MPAFPTDLQAVQSMTTAQWKAVLAAPPEEAMDWLVAAADLGHPGSQTLRGQWLLDGRGVERDPEQAFVWFEKAAAQGDAMGMNMAGRCLENGWGVARDLTAAIDWYRQAASQDLDAGLYNFANQLASGEGLPRNDGQAFALYARAAALGHAKSMTKAGRFHEEGLGVPKNVSKAIGCYRQGAEGGDFRGQYHYARLLAARGETEQALLWLRRVPLTATPRFLEEVGQLLSGSTNSRFLVLGRDMLALAELSREQQGDSPHAAYWPSAAVVGE